MTQAVGMLRAAIAGQDGRGRAAHDFYPTPPEATIALLPEIKDFPNRIWEPACGDGAIARIIEDGWREVVATDIVDRGYGESGVDFLEQNEPLADAIVTNPPFGKLASRFIEHAFLLKVPYIAMLFNVNFWHAKSRTALFEQRRPDAILPLTWRLDFTGSARPYFNCIWTVWRHGTRRDPIYRRLERPVDLLG